MTITPRQLTLDEALEITQDIKNTTEHLWELFLEAHEGKAWIPLGYRSWNEYVMREFHMSRSRSYQILDLGRVITAFEDAIGECPQKWTPDLTEREARRIKPHLEQALEEN
jgi:hypothetical protein